MSDTGAYDRPVATFCLVHGSWHGAWCWEPLVAELEARGHVAVAVDLPSDDADAGCSQYADAVTDSLADAEAPILVGHSMGGLTIPLVAERRAVRRLVYLCALVPRPGKGPWELEDGEPEPLCETFVGYERDELGRSVWRDLDAAVEQLYPDCEPASARAAAARLRPQGPVPNDEPCPLQALPNVPTTTILATEDRAVDPEWVRWTAQNRLGLDAVELPGGHSPMLARPAQLAAALARLS